MIDTETSSTFGALIHRLRSKGERLAQLRANGITRQVQSRRHPWRSAERLWPDLFKD